MLKCLRKKELLLKKSGTLYGGGGFTLFIMCSGSFDIALAADGVDICRPCLMEI
jgi:hypothetical protein